MIDNKETKKKSRKPQQRIIVGETYGEITVLDKSGGRQPIYSCRCKKCKSVFSAIGQQIFRYEKIGCSECRRAKRQREREENSRNYIGCIFGDLVVIDSVGLKFSRWQDGREYTEPVMLCKCQKCGSETEIPLQRLKQGGANQCAECNRKNLADGREINQKAFVGGTLITAIDGRRKPNKNSSTGYNGVSYVIKSGMYRAYINFRRKQYHLGSYAKIEDAIAARKEAEKNIYGDFLKWYADTYPEKWAKIKKKEPGE